MKSFTIVMAFCVAMMGCAADPETPKESKELMNDFSPSYAGGGGGYNPCGRTYVLEFPLPDGGLYRKEVPVYCNPYADEYYGDPPDWKQEVNPWDTQTIPQLETNERVQNVR